MPVINDVEQVLESGGLISRFLKGYKQRDGQIAMAKAIMDGFRDRRTVLVNAPTGNGKSIGGLVPAILSKDLGPTIVSTATKALQMQYKDKDLPLLHEAFKSVGQDFKSHVLKGRENYVCIRRLKEYLTESDIVRTEEDIQLYKDVILPWIDVTELGDFEELDVSLPPTLKSCICSNGDNCDPKCKCTDCFYKKNKALASEADIIVVNHDLLALHLSLRAKHGISILPDAYGVIVDEAHKFEDIITKYLGFKLSKFTFRNLAGTIRNYLKKLRVLGANESFDTDDPDKEDEKYESVFDALTRLDSLASEFMLNFDVSDSSQYRLTPSMIDDEITGLGQKINSILTYLDEQIPSASSVGVHDTKVTWMYGSIKNRLHDVSDKLMTVLAIEQYQYEIVFWADLSKANAVINSAPISVAKYTHEWLFTRRSDDSYADEYGEDSHSYEYGCVTLMSATLCTNKNFTFIKNRLGISKYYDGTNVACLTELIVPEVFDYRHQCLLYMPRGITDPPTDNARDKQVFTRQICQTLTSVADIVDGGILALFTSYMEMEKVYNLTSDQLRNRLAFNQRMYNKQKLLEMFKENRDSVLYATASFWEGVDVQGDALSCVIIDRLPFQVPSDPVIEARIEYIKSHGGDWFNDYYLPMMIVALQQGFGRLIRTKDDMGVVILMDNRLVSKPYRRKILNSLPDCLHTRRLDKVELFFEVVKQKRRIRKHKKDAGE